MPDMSQLLRKPVSDAKRPPTMPIGDYPGIITGYETKFNERFNPKTYQIQVNVRLTGLPDGLDPSELPAGLDVTKRQLRIEYDYQTEDGKDAERLWMLNALFDSLGIDAAGRSYEEVLPELQGKMVLAQVTQYMEKDKATGQATGEVGGNNIKKLVAMR